MSDASDPVATAIEALVTQVNAYQANPRDRSGVLEAVRGLMDSIEPPPPDVGAMWDRVAVLAGPGGTRDRDAALELASVAQRILMATGNPRVQRRPVSGDTRRSGARGPLTRQPPAPPAERDRRTEAVAERQDG